ncbi:MAG TPA: hypothetical protein VFO27_13265 [Bryobacteraceae bacterium]|nr:hypothetical protein [Bryobacteraceae bacterium]
MALPPVKLLPHPITYSFKGRQYVAVEGGSDVVAFDLFDEAKPASR